MDGNFQLSRTLNIGSASLDEKRSLSVSRLRSLLSYSTSCIEEKWPGIAHDEEKKVVTGVEQITLALDCGLQEIANPIPMFTSRPNTD